jgi:hypothetical protein
MPERKPLLRGLVDGSSSVPTVKLARLSSGAATAVQIAENAAVQETDA